MRLISEPIDVCGQNIYNGRCIRMGEDGKPQEVCRYEGFPKTAIQWPVTLECLQWGPKFLYERYHKPIYITENGLSCKIFTRAGKSSRRSGYQRIFPVVFDG